MYTTVQCWLNLLGGPSAEAGDLGGWRLVWLFFSISTRSATNFWSPIVSGMHAATTSATPPQRSKHEMPLGCTGRIT